VSENEEIGRTVLRDAFVVAARVRKSGGIFYQHDAHQTLVAGDNGDGGDREVTRWRTTREIPDKEELKMAQTLRARLLRKLTTLGVKTDAGFVVPKSWILPEDEAEEGFCGHGVPRKRACGRCEAYDWYANAVVECDAFNSTATHNRLYPRMAFLMMEDSGTGEMVAEDLRDLLGKLLGALDQCDPKEIRTVIRRMEGYAELVVPEVGGPLGRALEAARAQAGGIVEVLRETAGDMEIAREVIDMGPVELARFALDEVSPDTDFDDEEDVGDGFFEAGAVDFDDDEDIE